MVSDVSDDKEFFRHLGLLSNEVIHIRDTLQTIDSQEYRVRAALDELTLKKEILIEQTNRLETIVKQAATAAFVDAELEHERQQSGESEKSALHTQITEMEETLQTKEARVRDLQEQFTAKIEDLNEQIREKDSLLQVRDTVLKDLKTAAQSLNRLVSGLSSGGESSAVLLDEPLDNPKGETTAAIMEIEERTSMEIERLKRAIREKELALAAKSAEIEMTKQEMSGRIEELETALDAKRNRKPRLVNFHF